jgi:hypothetical protein
MDDRTGRDSPTPPTAAFAAAPVTEGGIGALADVG